jgi:hypothetical protein
MYNIDNYSELNPKPKEGEGGEEEREVEEK